MPGILAKYQNQLLLALSGAPLLGLAASSGARSAWEPIGEAQREALLAAAEACLEQPVPALLASDYLRYAQSGDERVYRRAYFARRDMLKSLAMGLCLEDADRYIPRLGEVIWAICEETSWMLPSSLALGSDLLAPALPDAATQLVDPYAADTAADLTWVYQIAGARLNELTPEFALRIGHEVYRRVIAPFSELSDTAWMRGVKSDLFRCLSGAITAFLCFERDDKARWQCMRKAWQLLDRTLEQLSPDGGIMGGVTGWQKMAAPVMDCLSMVCEATGGEIDARDEPLIQRMCRFPALCHIAGGWFVNPGNRSMWPELDGASMYRVGAAAGDKLLMDLGAYLCHAGGPYSGVARESLPDMRQLVFQALHQPEIDEAARSSPARLQTYLPVFQMLLARLAEDDRAMTLVFRGGDNGTAGAHFDVGDFLLFSEGQPALCDIGIYAETALHNLPTVDGFGQRPGAEACATDVTWQLEAGYAMLSMNIARAYPKEAGIYAWQRTALISRGDGLAQLIDVFDLDRRAEVTFHFITPIEPTVVERHAQLGAIRMRWDEGLTCTVDPFALPQHLLPEAWQGKLYHIALTTEQPVDRGKFTFNFSMLRTYG